MTRQTELMAISESATKKRWQFWLSNASKGVMLLRYAPDGWEKSRFSIIRNEKYKGLFRKVSVNELTFVKDARDYLRDVYEGQGINAVCTFYVYRWNDTTQAYAEYFAGKVDFSTYKISETGVTVEAIDTSLHEKIKNRENTIVDLLKRTSIGGYSIPAFTGEPQQLTFPAFNIVAIATWNRPAAASTTSDAHRLPMQVVTSEFTEADDQAIDSTDNCFTASLANRTLAIEGTACGTITFDEEEVSVLMTVQLLKNGANIATLDTIAISFATNYVFSIAFSSSISIVTGDTLAIRVLLSGVVSGHTTQYSDVWVQFRENIDSVSLSSCTAFPWYEALLRCCQHLADGNDVLISEKFGRTDTPIRTYAGDGEIGHITKGLYVRGANAYNSTLPVTLSDLFASLDALFCLGMGIEGSQVVVEELSYFFDTSVVLDISGRIRENAIGKEVLPSWHFNRISAGYGSFEYQATGGLSEFNTKSEFTTVISVIDNIYSILSKYRADTQGIIALRKAGSNDTNDVKGDEDIFLVDAVRQSGLFYARTDEGFDEIGGGVDADNWYNVRLSPGRNLRRHGQVIRAGLERNLGSAVRWQTSDKNTQLYSQMTGETAPIREDDDIVVNDLTAPMWWAEAYTVECELDYDDLTAILTNPRGLIKLADEKYGWILEVNAGNSENKAEMRLLRANNTYIGI